MNGIAVDGIKIASEAENGDTGVRLLSYFRHRWLDFRIPEIESLAQSGVSWEYPFGGNIHSPFWYVHLPDLQTATDIAKRSILLKVPPSAHHSRIAQSFIQVWGEGSTFEELQSSIEECPEHVKAPFYSKEISFRVVVDAWGCKMRQEEKVQSIEKLQYLPLKGRIDLKQPNQIYWLIIADPSRLTGFPGVPCLSITGG